MIRSHFSSSLENMLVLHPACPAERPRSECRLPVVNGLRGGTPISDHPGRECGVPNRRISGQAESDVPPQGATTVDNPPYLFILSD